MNQKMTVEWLRAIGYEPSSVGSDWVKVSCPLAHWRHRGADSNPSFGVKIGPGDGGVFCFGCQYRGSQLSLMAELRRRGALTAKGQARASKLLEAAENDPEAIEWAIEEARTLDPFPEFALDVLEPAYKAGTSAAHGHVHPYLELREVPYDVAARLDLRWDDYRQRIVFPVRGWNGILYGLHGRCVVKSDLPYLMYPYDGKTNPQVLYGEHLLDLGEPVVMTESVFDLARVLEIWPNVCCPLTANLTKEKLDRFEDPGWPDLIVSFFDEDKAGDLARKTLEENVPKATKVSHAHPPDGQDPGDLTIEEVAEILTPFLPS